MDFSTAIILGLAFYWGCDTLADAIKELKK